MYLLLGHTLEVQNQIPKKINITEWKMPIDRLVWNDFGRVCCERCIRSGCDKIMYFKCCFDKIGDSSNINNQEVEAIAR